MAQVETSAERESIFSATRRLLDISTDVHALALSLVERLDGVQPVTGDGPPAPRSEEKNMEPLLQHIREVLEMAQAKLNHADHTLGK